MTNSKKKTSAKTTDRTKPASTTKEDTNTDTDAETKSGTTMEQKKPTIPGVRATNTRPYIAGKIIAKHGLEAGVTKEMVAELDAEYGQANPRESQFCLRNAWHAVRGFKGDNGSI